VREGEWRGLPFYRQGGGQATGGAVALANGETRAGVTRWGRGDVGLLASAGRESEAARGFTRQREGDRGDGRAVRLCARGKDPQGVHVPGSMASCTFLGLWREVGKVQGPKRRVGVAGLDEGVVMVHGTMARPSF
jgi:hypothetical protein